MRKSAKNVSQGKGHALSRPPSGGLTCSESQVDDMLSAGESTEKERHLPTETMSEPSLAGARNEKYKVA
jgi:hypothetical protein